MGDDRNDRAVDGTQESDAAFSAGADLDPMAVIEERLEVEAIAQMVENMSQSKELNRRLQKAFGELRQQVATQDQVLGGLQAELRTALLDLELLRRAASSTGQSGVLERSRQQAQLTREVMPPERDHSVLGVRVNRHAPKTAPVNCAERLHLCKAACCRIFSVALTPAEVSSERYDWDPKRPYNLRRNRTGCAHLQSGGCGCTVRDERPRTCSNYSCENDPRIWSDFAGYELNPDLAKRLETLHVATPPPRQVEAAEATPEPELKPVAPGSSRASTAAAESASVAPEPMAPEPAEPATAAAAQAPDFSELRANRPAEPAKKFVPPSKGSD